MDKIHLPTTLYRASQVRELDRITIEDMGIPGICLMERASNAAFNLLQTRFARVRRIMVLCGIGNNGGDGYVLARLAYLAGYDVTVLQMGDTSQLQGDARIAFNTMTQVGLSVQVFSEKKLTVADVVVDALFGTGLNRAVLGRWREVIEAVNRCHCPVLSLDIPSGLHADTGAVLGVAIHATMTISFIGLKQGLFTGEGPDYAGEIYFDDLKIPLQTYKEVKAAATRIDYDIVKRNLSRRSRTTHKGNYGHALLIGGDAGMIGAIRMAAEAAVRVGTGKVTIATRSAHAALVNLMCPEIMCYGIETPEELIPLLYNANVVAIGPGLGQSVWARAMLDAVKNLQKPIIVDADALNLLAQMPFRFFYSILTPHVGEAARLLEISTSDIQADRFAAVQALQIRFGGVCVLKGAGSLICNPQGEISVCNLGNPGMATAGMGDVLTGVILGLLAQGFSHSDAAKIGVCLHAMAGDKAAERGERGLVPRDLFAWLRHYSNPHNT